MSVSADTLPDGETFGFIHHFDGTAVFFDPAEIFTNEEAVKAARDDGAIAADEDLPNPFYIRNPDTAMVRVPVSKQFTVTVLDNQQLDTTHRLDAGQFASLYCADGAPTWLYSSPENLAAVLRVSKGLVVRADERYVP